MILVAYDGSEQADKAFKKEAIELFKRDWGKNIHLLRNIFSRA